ncbi:hypothetical protein ABN763_09990 [Spongiivirga sp. MCCC 1A20706]|uniref:SecDF P1 head subdomain-containing protein n=1 Tax=Spongiivirga sp. MCCC 1A20706 TaxID=3160963 RepID=UPI003977BE6D
MRKLVLAIIFLVCFTLYNCLPLEKFRQEITIQIEDNTISKEEIHTQLSKRLDAYDIKLISSKNLGNNQLKLVCGFYDDIPSDAVIVLLETPGKIGFHLGLEQRQISKLHNQLDQLIASEIQKDTSFFKGESNESVFSPKFKNIVKNYVGIYQNSAQPMIESFLKTKTIDSILSSYITDYTYTFNYNKVHNNISLYVYDKKVYLTGANIIEAHHSFDQMAKNSINIQFDEIGTKKFEKLTNQAMSQGRTIPIIYEQQLLVSPMVATPIKEGSAQITGVFTDREIKEKVAILKSGTLPKIHVKSVTVVK